MTSFPCSRSPRLQHEDGRLGRHDRRNPGRPRGHGRLLVAEGPPGDRCQAHHWGYLLSGRIIVDYGERQETVVGGQAYYIEPGHLISFAEDSEAVEFTPTDQLEQTLAVVQENVAREEQSDG